MAKESGLWDACALKATGRRQHSQFEYDEAWLAAEDRFALAPGLQLREGSHFSSGKDDKRLALPGRFGDAAPDSWARALMTKALAGGLSEFDYLVLSDDRTRQGALRFLGEDMEPLSDLTPPIPRLVELERSRNASNRTRAGRKRKRAILPVSLDRWAVHDRKLMSKAMGISGSPSSRPRRTPSR